MHAFPIMLGVLCILAIAYRYYSAFLAAKVAVLDDSRRTPAHEFEDGQNYHPTNKWVLFGHHFAAISGAGPLIGPVLAVQFGYMPGLIWLLVGVCLAGAVQDFLILAASLRHKGRSLAQIAREEIGPVSGGASVAAILFIIIVALAGLGMAVVKALGGDEVPVPAMSRIESTQKLIAAHEKWTFKLPAETKLSVPMPGKAGDTEKRFRTFTLPHPQDVVLSNADDAKAIETGVTGQMVVVSNPASLQVPGSSWGVFTIGASIPIALLMGLWMYVLRKNAPRRIVEASVIGAVLLLACVELGSFVPGTALGGWLNLTRHQVILAMAIYGFVASILPVWLLLCPRDYLSSYLKIGTIGGLILGVLFVNPKLEMPAFVNFWQGNGPNFKGDIFPFLFITVMCGAISGFHALVSSGTTPKMVNRESDARMIGYGAMLMEGLVGIVALLAASSLSPGDYFAIQVPMGEQAALIQKFGEPLHEINGDVDNLQVTEVKVGENLRGRMGGAVTLAVGMSKIFANIPFFQALVAFWYHFAIMFEALFILTTIDTGTRIGRFLVQEIMGKVKPEFGRVDWWPGSILATTFIVFGWGWLLWTGEFNTIWPMFGISNQLLAVVALCVATTVIVNTGKTRYMPVTLIPLLFAVSTTMTAGYQMLGRFWVAISKNGFANAAGLNFALIAIMLICVVILVLDSARVWIFGRNRGTTLRPSPIAEPVAGE